MHGSFCDANGIIEMYTFSNASNSHTQEHKIRDAPIVKLAGQPDKDKSG